VLRRTLIASVLVLAAGVGLTACTAPHDSTGRVTVTIDSDAAAGQRYLVTVKDAQGQTVESERLASGQSSAFAGVPLGWITIRVAGWCTLHAKVVDGTAVSATLGPSGCST
jgi:hypothetical protein